MQSEIDASLNAVRGSKKIISLDYDAELENLLDQAASVESPVEFAQLQRTGLCLAGVWRGWFFATGFFSIQPKWSFLIVALLPLIECGSRHVEFLASLCDTPFTCKIKHRKLEPEPYAVIRLDLTCKMAFS